MDPNNTPATFHKQHITASQQLFSPLLTQYRGYQCERSPERNWVGKFALMVPAITSTEGLCVAIITDTRVPFVQDAEPPLQSLSPATIIKSATSSITQQYKEVVRDPAISSSKTACRFPDQIRFERVLLTSLACHAPRPAFIIAINITNPHFGHIAILIFHLAYRPFQGHQCL